MVAEQLLKFWGLVFSGLETGTNKLQFLSDPPFFLGNINLEVKILLQLRGCSHGGELIPFCGLLHLGEISPSLMKLYKKQCVHMRSEPAHLGEISLCFNRIPPK